MVAEGTTKSELWRSSHPALRRSVAGAKFCILLCICLLIGLLAGCSQRNAENARLAQAVRQRLTADSQLRGLSIGVTADNGVVTLSGVTATDAQRQAGATDANIIGAVTRVSDEIVSLQTLRAALQQKLGSDPALKGASIFAAIANNTATLTGEVRDSGQSAAAEAIARQVLSAAPEVKLVDQIAVVAPPPAPAVSVRRVVARSRPAPARMLHHPRPAPVVARSTAPVAPPPGTRTIHQFLAVSVMRPWSGDTGITLEPGDRVTVHADGYVRDINGSCPICQASGPDGSAWTACSVLNGFPAPGHRCYSLVGKIGDDGQPFEVGSHKAFVADRAGVLYLGANAIHWKLNSGSWAVHLTVAEPVGGLAQPGSTGRPAPESGFQAKSAMPAHRTAPSAAPTAPPPPALVTLAAGTELDVRLSQPLSSDTSASGQTFTATLAAPLALNGQIVVPVEAEVTGVVLYAHSAGHFKGRSELRLSLSSLSYNGQRYVIATDAWDEMAASRGKETAKRGLLGGIGGAVLGGILGGGKGAAIGGAGGAGGAGAVQGLTKPPEVTLPVEAPVQFQLVQPVQVQPSAALLRP